MRRQKNRILALFVAFLLAIAPIVGVPFSTVIAYASEDVIFFNSDDYSFNSEGRLIVQDPETGVWAQVNIDENSGAVVPGEVLAPANSFEHAQEIANAYGLELISYAHGIAVMIAQNPELAVFQSRIRRICNMPVLSFNWIYSIDNESSVFTPVRDDFGDYPWAIRTKPIEYGLYYLQECNIDSNVYTQLHINANVDMDHWQHEVMDNERAWGISTGTGVVVAVIDTGIDIYHPAFAGRILSNSFNSYTNEIGLLAVQDDLGHGTHVSGIVAAAPTAFSNVSGVAPEAYIMKVKANIPTNPHFFDTASLLRGINYAVDNGADIINMSLGRHHMFGPDALEHMVIANAVNRGITVIAAAGNDSHNRAGFPAAYPEVIAVSSVMMGSIGPTFDSSYSNFGPEIDIAAPGTNIFAPHLNGTYRHLSGTSMAAPNVAGTAALIISTNPGSTPGQIRERLNLTARQAGMLGGDLRYGSGIVSSFAALLGPNALHTVTYHFNDGVRGPVTVGIAPGAMLLEPARHIMGNRLLTGWSVVPNGSLFDFQTPITTNMELHAQWADAEAVGSWIEAFPDANFRHFVHHLLTEIDGILRTDDSMMTTLDVFLLATIEQLSAPQRNIADLTGIEYFTGLRVLEVSHNPLSQGTLDLSSNPLLTVLSAWHTSMSGLNVSNNPLLTFVSISGGAGGMLSELDLSNNPALISLSARYFRNLTTLDLTNNTELFAADLWGNDLVLVDLAYSPYFSWLTLGDNRGVNHSVVTDIDLSMLPNLYFLRYHHGRYSELDLSNNPALRYVTINDNFLTSLDLSNNIALSVLDVHNNFLTDLDLSANHALVSLNVHGNQLESLDLSNNAELKLLQVSNNSLTTLDVSNHELLGQLIISDNQIKHLDVSRNSKLGHDVSFSIGGGWGLIAFGLIWAENNMLTSLDISNTAHNWNDPDIPGLARLNVSNNYMQNPDTCVTGWQGRNLVLDYNFIFWPQREHDRPSIIEVIVTPETVIFTPGQSYQFEASVLVSGNAPDTVTWSVSGHHSIGTNISDSGLLTIGSNETARTLTINAHSTFDPTKYGTATATNNYDFIIYPRSLDFGTAYVGYTVGNGGIEPLAVSIANISVRDARNVTISVADTNSASFIVSPTWIKSIAVDETGHFTLVPVPGLGAGTHTAEITIRGESYPAGWHFTDVITASFTVIERTVDRSELSAAIAYALALRQMDFTPESWMRLLPVLNSAISVYNNSDATQYQVDAATEALLAAIEALVPYVPAPLPIFRFDIFNNGEGGSSSRPNPGLAAAGIIRMWTQLDGVNAPVYLGAADTIIATDQNGNCAEEFIRVNRVWQAGVGWLDYFNMIDVNKDGGSWQYINLYITVYEQTVHVLLVNANFEEPPVFDCIYCEDEGCEVCQPEPPCCEYGDCEVCNPRLPTFYLAASSVTVSNTNRHVSVFVSGTAEGAITLNLLDAAPELVLQVRDNLWTPTGPVEGLVIGVAGNATITQSRTVALEVTRDGVTVLLSIELMAN